MCTVETCGGLEQNRFGAKGVVVVAHNVLLHGGYMCACKISVQIYMNVLRVCQQFEKTFEFSILEFEIIFLQFRVSEKNTTASALLLKMINTRK